MRLLLFLAVFFLGRLATAAPAVLPLEKAVRSGAFSVSLVSTGGYCTKGLELSIKNNSCREYEIQVRPGLLFKPSDSSYQDLVIASSINIRLKPDSSARASLQTFCAKSYAHAPAPDLRYRYKGKAGRNLVLLLGYIMANRLAGYLGQQAVWVFTNNHPLGSIYDSGKPEASRALAAFAARLQGVPPPSYHTVYKAPRAGGAVFSPEVQELDADLFWTAEPRHMHYRVYREGGRVYTGALVTERISPAGHRLHVRFPQDRTPRGTYTIRVFDDGNYEYASRTVVVP